uniref:Uncharacterized protein n=1 Tax=Glossina palpalis gambiensis TaxID=67801 RepID=A0A1B0AYC3_9MUSC
MSRRQSLDRPEAHIEKKMLLNCYDGSLEINFITDVLSVYLRISCSSGIFNEQKISFACIPTACLPILCCLSILRIFLIKHFIIRTLASVILTLSVETQFSCSGSECNAHKDLYIICAAMGLKNGTNTKIILRLFDDIQIVAKIAVFRKVNVVLAFVRYLPMRNSTANGNCPTKASYLRCCSVFSNASLSRRLLR